MVDIIIGLIIFFTFFMLSFVNMRITIAFGIILFASYVIAKLSFFPFNNMILLAWVACIWLGIVSRPLLYCIMKGDFFKREISFKLLLMVLWGICVILFGMIHKSTLLSSLNKFCYFYTFPFLAYPAYVLVRKNIRATESFYKIIFGVSFFVVLFSAVELCYINFLNGDIFNLPWIKNYYSIKTHYTYFGKDILETLQWQRGFGFLCQPHFSGHLIAIAAICLISRISYKKQRRHVFIERSALIVAFTVVVLSFVKTIWVGLTLVLFWLLWKNFKRTSFFILAFLFSLVSVVMYVFPEIFEVGKNVFLGKEDFYSVVLDTARKFGRFNSFASFWGGGFGGSVSDISFVKGDVFIFKMFYQIGAIGIFFFLYLTGAPLFYPFRNIIKEKDYIYMVRICQAIVLLGYISLFHYPTLMNFGIQAIFYTSVGILYALKHWDKQFSYGRDTVSLEPQSAASF